MVQVPNLEDGRSDFDNSQICVFPNFHDLVFSLRMFCVAVIFAYTFHHKKCSTHPGSKVYKLFQVFANLIEIVSIKNPCGSSQRICKYTQ